MRVICLFALLSTASLAAFTPKASLFAKSHAMSGYPTCYGDPTCNYPDQSRIGENQYVKFPANTLPCGSGDYLVPLLHNGKPPHDHQCIDDWCDDNDYAWDDYPECEDRILIIYSNVIPACYASYTTTEDLNDCMVETGNTA